MKIILRKIIHLAFLLFFLINNTYGADYDSAVDFFIAEDYISALNEFEQLYEEQPYNIDIIYALGLTLNPLDQDSEAFNYFILLNDSDYSYVAKYYVSMIALRNGEVDIAINSLEKLAIQIDDMEANELANNSLLEIENDSSYDYKPLYNTQDGSYLFVELGLSSQDGIIDPNGLIGTDQNDITQDIILAASMNLFSLDNSNINIGGTFFGENYTDYSDYNISANTVFIEQEGIFNQDWLSSHLWRINLSSSQIWLADKKYLDQIDISLFDEVFLNDNFVLLAELNYQESVNGDMAYYQYAGSSKMIAIGLQSIAETNWLIQYSYLIENNNDYSSIDINSNLTVFDTFTSYSGETQYLGLQVDIPITNTWSSSLSASFEQTLYNNADIYLYDSSDSLLTTAYRVANLSQFNIDVVRNFSDRLFLTLSYEYINNNSNIDFFDFKSNVFKISTSYLF